MSNLNRTLSQSTETDPLLLYIRSSSQKVFCSFNNERFKKATKIGSYKQCQIKKFFFEG